VKIARHLLALALLAATGQASPPPKALRAGPVSVDDHCLKDSNGHFLGLGVSYFTALWRCKHDRPRLNSDLAFLSKSGFNYIRILSMVGYYPAWQGLEIAPVRFTNKPGATVEAWPDYWQQLAELIDTAYDSHQLRCQLTFFADAQLMPEKAARMAHMQRFLGEILPGREHKIILLEVANEAWQNGFPGDPGVAELREFSAYLDAQTTVPVAITSNHDWPDLGSPVAFETTYKDATADIATWHFSRDLRSDGGWKPVYDCWDFGQLPGFPPVSSNEPIGPGSSVNTESDPTRLVMAAAFAFTAKLPMFVFHSEAGVFGKSRFEGTAAIGNFAPMLGILPPDLPNWRRNDGFEADAPFTLFTAGQPNQSSADLPDATDGCLRNVGARRDAEFVCVPIGILKDGLELEARHSLEFTAHDPLTGVETHAATLAKGQRTRLPAGPTALIIRGRLLP
jgi:hypothetical protein